MKWLARIRPLNIIIVLATQLLVYLFFILPIAIGDAASAEYPPFHYYLVIAIITCIVTVGGYIINDIYDIEIDRVNKPLKVMLKPKSWVIVYKILFLIGLALVVYLSVQLSNIFYTPIYLISWVLLNVYSKKLKCLPLIGNVVVALMSACAVVAIIAPAFSIYMTFDEESLRLIFLPMIYYTIMAFMLTLVREIVKDLEDIEGDKLQGCRTLAVASGVTKTKVFTQFFHSVIIFFSMAFMYIFYGIERHIWVGFIALLILLLLWQAYRLSVGRGPKDFRKIQRLYKLMMVAGIIVFLLEPYILE